MASEWMLRQSLPLVYQWDALRSPPKLALRLANRRPTRALGGEDSIETDPVTRPFDFTAAMTALCADIIRRTPTFAHIDLSRLLVAMTLARNGRRHGLQARVTPLRFRGGALATVHRGKAYQVQRMVVDRREILYVVTFCLPRFLNRDFDDKLVTVFHELYHISPAFDGDLRRHKGRYCAHTGSQKKYDAHMAKLAAAYLKEGGDPSHHAFLRQSFAELCRRHGTVIGLHLPRPKLIPVPFTPHGAETSIEPTPHEMPK